jgi:hypothetical protein
MFIASMTISSRALEERHLNANMLLLQSLRDLGDRIDRIL